MRWPWRWHRAAALSAGQAAALDAYRALPRPELEAPIAGGRCVVVDVEASGLDAGRARLIAIGAVAVSQGLLQLHESFEIVLRQPRPSGDDNILVHGIGAAEQLAGREPGAALLEFLGFAGKAPLIAFHAHYDRTLIERSTVSWLGVKPENAWLDLALLAPALLGRSREQGRDLDAWTSRLGIENAARHSAAADALAAGELLLAVLAAAGARGIDSWVELMRLERAARWLRRIGQG
jgi:DNA polymerase-3 subunit epsilon